MRNAARGVAFGGTDCAVATNLNLLRAGVALLALTFERDLFNCKELLDDVEGPEI